MASGPITSWQVDGEKVESVTDFMFLGSKITADGYSSHKIKRCLLLGRKAMRNLDNVLKSKDITLPTKVHIAKAMIFPISSVQSLSCARLFANPWTAARQASLSITNSQSLLKLMSIELVMPSNHLILCRPFSYYPQSFPASGSFQVSQLFTSRGQSIGVSASASVLPTNIQDWSPLGWTGWISLQSKGLSRVFNPTVQKHQFFSAQLSLWSSSHIHTWLLGKP